MSARDDLIERAARLMNDVSPWDAVDPRFLHQVRMLVDAGIIPVPDEPEPETPPFGEVRIGPDGDVAVCAAQRDHPFMVHCRHDVRVWATLEDVTGWRVVDTSPPKPDLVDVDGIDFDHLFAAVDDLIALRARIWDARNTPQEGP